MGNTWHLDEVCVTIHGQGQHLYQNGDTIDILVQGCLNQQAAERFFCRLLKGQGRVPRWLMTDKLRAMTPLIAQSCSR